jgi:hypothetical protein
MNDMMTQIVSKNKHNSEYYVNYMHQQKCSTSGRRNRGEEDGQLRRLHDTNLAESLPLQLIDKHPSRKAGAIEERSSTCVFGSDSDLPWWQSPHPDVKRKGGIHR